MKQQRGAIGRWLVLTLLIIALAAAAFAFIRRRSGPSGQHTVVERIIESDFVREVTGTGVAQAEQARTLSFIGSGTVAEILVNEGENVEAGTLLARLNTSSLERDIASTQASLQSARADLERLRSQLDIDRLEVASAKASANDALATAQEALADAERQLNTTQQLFEAGAASQQELNSAREAVSQAERQVNRAEISLQSASSREASFGQLAAAQLASSEAQIASLETTLGNLEERMGEATLSAPFAGVVTDIGFEVGDSVGPGGAEGIHLVDVSTLTVEARFDENRALELAQGQSATIAPDAAPDRRLDATVSRVSAVAARENNTAQVIAELTFDENAQEAVQQGLIRPGYTVTARVIVNKIEDALLVPLEAISEEDQVSWVYRIEETAPGEGTAVRTELEVLDRNATVAAVKSDSLSEDSLIAVINLEMLEDGSAVQYTPLAEGGS